MKKRQTMKNLPEELITEILLSNLSVKSLLRFKSVSKSWRSLISSAYFVQDHLNRSNSHHTLIGTFYSKQTSLTLTSCSLNSLLDETNQNDVVSTLDHHCPAITDSRIRIIGSCNGLILIQSERCYAKWSGLFLWNPSTRKVKTIPSPLSCPTQVGERVPLRDFLTYGFGYDDSTHDYKVVCFIVHCILDHTDTYETKIYSLQSDSWKKIDNSGFKMGYDDDPCKFVNGKLHGLAYKEFARSIFSISLGEGKEKYQVMAWPKVFLRVERSFAKLENLGGYLSLIRDHPLSSSRGVGVVDVWVMMMYGVVESWTKIWALSDFYHDLALPVGVVTKQFWVTKNGDIFVFFGKSKVVVFNGNNKLREYQIGGAKLRGEGDINHIVYVESLVSPLVD